MSFWRRRKATFRSLFWRARSGEVWPGQTNQSQLGRGCCRDREGVLDPAGSLLNDLEANAYGIGELNPEDVAIIQEGPPAMATDAWSLLGRAWVKADFSGMV